jgi:hypothetical protein
MEKKTLFSTDYVIYNPTTNQLVRWSSDDDVVIFGSEEEADIDCNYAIGEQVIPCTDLPEELQQLIINQLNK